jgi:hypothetical protein
MQTENIENLEAIAGSLGEGWKAVPNNDGCRGAHLHGPASEDIWLSRTWAGPGRLFIKGEFPTALDGGGSYGPYNARDKHSITVAGDKAPAVIARDIERRLLPEYRLDLAKALKSQIAHMARREAIKQTSNRLMALGCKLNHNRESGDRVSLFADPEVFHVDTYATVHVDSTGVKFEISMDGDSAEKVLTFLKELGPVARESSELVASNA